tara:strand:+ start:799 stop:1209 length:411 start_codon:yes stop_codon:yes gene_type:complete
MSPTDAKIDAILKTEDARTLRAWGVEEETVLALMSHFMQDDVTEIVQNLEAYYGWVTSRSVGAVLAHYPARVRATGKDEYTCCYRSSAWWNREFVAELYAFDKVIPGNEVDGPGVVWVAAEDLDFAVSLHPMFGAA